MLDFFGSADPQKVIEKVSKLRFEGKTDKALQILEKALKGKPTDFRLYLEIASIECSQNRYTKGVITFKKARSINPSAIDELTNFVEDTFYKGEKNWSLASYLIDLYIEKKKMAEADKIYKSLDSKDKEELRKKTEKEFSALEKKGTFGRTDIVLLYKMALIAFNMQDYDKAEKIMEIIIEHYPREMDSVIGEIQRWSAHSYGNPMPYIILGKIYLTTGEQDKAMTAFQQGINLEPSVEEKVAEILEHVSEDISSVSSDNIEQMINLYIKRNDKEKALKLISSLEARENPPYKDIINFYVSLEKIYPNNKEIKIRALKVAALIGDIDIVDREINRLIDDNYGEILSLLPVLNDMIKNGYESAKLYQNISRILVLNGEYDSAVLTLQRAFELDNSDTYVVNELLSEILKNDMSQHRAAILLAKIYSQEGDMEKALMLYDHALSLEEPDYKEIIEDARQLVARYPDNIEIKTLLAKAYIKSGDITSGGDIIKQIILSVDDPLSMLPVLDSIANAGKEYAEIAIEIYQTLKWEEKFVSLFALGELYRKAEQFKDAIKYYRKALSYDETKINIIKEAVLDSIGKGASSLPILLYGVQLMLDTNDTSGVDMILKMINEKMKPDEMDSTEVVTLYQRLKEKLPNNVEVSRGLVRSLFARNLYEEVIKEATALLETMKEDKTGEIYFILGKTYSITGNLTDASFYLGKASFADEKWVDESLSILNEMIEKDYNNVKVHYILAQCSSIIGDYTTAADELFTIIQLDPAKTDVMLKELLSLINRDRTNAALYFYVGRIYVKRRDIAEAIRYLETCVTLDDGYAENIITIFEEIESEIQSPLIPFFLGKLYVKRQLYTRAAEYLFTAVEVDPSLIEQALTIFNNILTESPKEIATRMALSEIYIKTKKYINAARILQEVIEIDKDQLNAVSLIFDSILVVAPENIEVLFVLSYIYEYCEKYEEMLKIFDKIIAIDVSMRDRIIDQIENMDVRTDEILFYLVNLYIALTDFKDAVKVLNEALFMNFNSKPKVIEYLNEILKIEPSQVDAGFLMGRLLFDDEDYKESVKIFGKIVDHINDVSIKREVLFMIFQSYQKLEEKEEAKKVLKQIREISTANEYYDLIMRLRYKARDERISKISALLEAEKATNDEKILLARFYKEKGEIEKALELLNFIPDKENNKQQIERLKELASVYETKGDIISSLEILAQIYPYDENVKSDIIRLSEECGFYREAINWSEENMLDKKVSSILSRIGNMHYPALRSSIKIG